jgi:hypothetical protein
MQQVAMSTNTSTMSEARLEWHLDNWAEWQFKRENRGGYPTRASGGIGLRASNTFDSMVQAADDRCARAVEAILDGLMPAERAAVWHFHLGVDFNVQVFRFPHVGYGAERLYEQAREKIRKGLVSKGIQ